MKLPLKLDINSYKNFFIKNNTTFYEAALLDWLKELSESYNSTINYIEQLEERIRDLEKNELY